jgi:hypothetical protein
VGEEQRSHDEIVAFLRLCIDSVESLEVLTLLLEQPEKNWTAKTLSLQIRSSEGSVEKRLKSLVACRVIVPAEGRPGQFRPASPEMERSVRETVAFYRLRPHRAMEILYSKPESAMQSFADAFRFGKKENS